MRRLHPRQIEAFRAVMLAGGMTAGADLLGISQPAMSRLIRDFELALGLPLFERGAGGRFRAGEDARVLLEVVERHFAAMDEVLRTAQRLVATRAGRLSIAAGPTLALRLLPGVLREVTERHPRASVELRTGTATEVAAMVARREVDIGLAAAIAPTVGLELTPLPGREAACAVPAGHRLARHEEIGVEELAGEPFIAIGGQGLFQLRIAAALEAAGIEPRIRLVAPSSAAAAYAVAEGLGLSIIDPFAALMLEGTGARVARLRPRIVYELALMRPTGAPSSPLVDVVSAALEAAVTGVAHRGPR